MTVRTEYGSWNHERETFARKSIARTARVGGWKTTLLTLALILIGGCTHAPPVSGGGHLQYSGQGRR